MFVFGQINGTLYLPFIAREKTGMSDLPNNPIEKSRKSTIKINYFWCTTLSGLLSSSIEKL